MLRNDAFWKGLIEDIFPYFIPFFLPAYAHLFDLNQPVEFLDKELQQLYPQGDEQELRFVDKLVKVFTVNGEEKWILIHIEVQGYNDPDFGKRMFTYFYRILDRYGVPVIAIAIFTDSNKSFSPDQYHYIFAGTENVYHFNTYKVLEQEEVQLGQSDNPFAIAILTVLLALKAKKLSDENLLDLKLALIKQMHTRQFSKKTINHLLDFIKLYVRFAKPETAIKFDNEIDLLTNNIQPMGIREQIIQMAEQEGLKQGLKQGRQEGRQEGHKERDTMFVENLLRNTDFSDEKIAAIAVVPIQFVKEIKEKLK